MEKKTKNNQTSGEEYVAGIKIDYSPEFSNAAKLVLETDKPLIYLTGKAGTGKTTFLKYIVSQYKENLVVLAPTGKAAVNAGGQTIHSFFKLDFNPHLPSDSIFSSANIYGRLKYNNNKRQLLENLSLIIIDEVSMVRCDVLDAIDKILRVFRKNNVPFGGVRMLLIGDVFQLPPVASNVWNILKQEYDSPYFFASKAYKSCSSVYIELKKPYRQQEKEFLSLLDKIRVGNISEEELNAFNSKVVITNKKLEQNKDKPSIFLAPRTYMIDQYNDAEFSKLQSETHEFKAGIIGDFSDKSYPVDVNLKLKIGAQVMIMKNCWDSTTQSFVYYNGNIGIVKEIKAGSIVVELTDGDFAGRIVEVEKAGWDNIEYRLVEKEEEQNGIKKITKTVETVVKGTFIQYPLKLAWAVSIHKSQGMTFDNIYADLSECFDYGQVYVALSRCRRLNGVHLLAPIKLDTIKIDSKVLDFANTETPSTLIVQEIEGSKADKLYKQCREELKNGLILEALATLEEAIQVRDDRDTPAFKKYCRVVHALFNHYKHLASSLQDKVGLLKDQVNEMESTIKEKEQIHEDDALQMQNLQEQVADLKEQLLDANTLCESRNQKIEELKWVVGKKEEANKEKEQQIQDYRLQISDLDKQRSVAEVLHKGQMELKAQEISQLNKKVEEQVDALKHEKMMNESNALKIRELETDKMKLQMEIDRLNNMTWWQKLRNKQ